MTYADLPALFDLAFGDAVRAAQRTAGALRTFTFTIRADTCAFRGAIHRTRSRLGQIAAQGRRPTRRQKRRMRKARRR